MRVFFVVNSADMKIVGVSAGGRVLTAVMDDCGRYPSS